MDRLLTETTTLGSVSYTYDANSRLRTITQSPLNPVDIQYDALNRRTLLTLPNGVSTEYQYDLASRLTALIYRNTLGPLGDLQYSDDPAGNRTAVGGSFARTLLPDAVASATYDPANRQLTFGTKTMTFDDNGNLLTQTDPSGTITYSWDARNRLTGLAGPSVNGSFAYDGLGRRARKTIGSVTTEFLYDGLDLAKETGGTGDVSYLRTLAIDEALTRTDATDTVHYIADALGSTIALTNPTGGSTTTYTYEPYGRVAVEGTAINRIQYTGRENDGSGLYYYRTRYYPPTSARFVQADRIGFRGGTNLYVYLSGDPVNFTDPFGLFRVYVHDIGGRQGPAYGAIVRVESDDGTTSITVPGSSWPNPSDKSPGVEEGIYDARYSATGHQQRKPGIRLEDGRRIPTIRPNPYQKGSSYAIGINIHCGWSGTWRGSAGCITIPPDYCQSVWDLLKEGESGKVTITRRERPGF